MSNMVKQFNWKTDRARNSTKHKREGSQTIFPASSAGCYDSDNLSKRKNNNRSINRIPKSFSDALFSEISAQRAAKKLQSIHKEKIFNESSSTIRILQIKCHYLVKDA